MAYLISPVQYALKDTADILGTGFREAGQNAVRKEQLGLQRDVTEAGMRRQAEMDALQRPALELGAEQAKMNLEKLNQPLTVGSIAKDHYGLTHLTSVPTGEKQSTIEKLAGLFDAKIDTNQSSPHYGKFVKKDGSYVTNKDMHLRGEEAVALLLANTDPVHAANDQLGRYVERLSNLPEGSPEAEKTKENMRRAIKWLESPEMQLQTMQKQRDQLAKFEGPDFEKGVARLDAQIDGMKKSIAEAVTASKKQAWEEEKLKTQEAGKDRRANISAQARKDAADRVAGKKGPQLTAGEKAELDLLKSDYRSAESIIREYRKGSTEFGLESSVSPAEAARATKAKTNILFKIKKFGMTEEDLKQEAEEKAAVSWRDYDVEDEE